MSLDAATIRLLSTPEAVIWLDRVDGRRMLVVVIEPINGKGTTVVRLAAGTKLLRITKCTVVGARAALVERWSDFIEIAEMQERGEFLRHDRRATR